MVASHPMRENAELLATSPVFAGCALDEIRTFLDRAAEHRIIDTNTNIVTEGEAPDALYFLLSGEVDVLRRADDGRELALARLSAVQTLGEFALFDPAPRNATLRAVGRCELLRVPLDRLLPTGGRELSARLRDNISIEMVREFRDANRAASGWLEEKLRESEKRVALGRYMVRILSICALYMFVMSEVTNSVAFGPWYSTILVLVQILLGTSIAVFIKTSTFPAKVFGLTLHNWKRVCREAILWTLPLLAVLLATKAILINTVDHYSEVPLFDWGAPWRTSWLSFIVVNIVYSLFIPMQEFISRSGMQAPFELFLDGRRGKLIAIALAAVIFSAMHLHFGLVFAVAVMPVGIYWGVMFSKQQSLLGVVVSHLLVGNFIFSVMGVGGIIS